MERMLLLKCFTITLSFMTLNLFASQCVKENDSKSINCKLSRSKKLTKCYLVGKAKMKAKSSCVQKGLFNSFQNKSLKRKVATCYKRKTNCSRSSSLSSRSNNSLASALRKPASNMYATCTIKYNRRFCELRRQFSRKVKAKCIKSTAKSSEKCYRKLLRKIKRK